MSSSPFSKTFAYNTLGNDSEKRVKGFNYGLCNKNFKCFPFKRNRSQAIEFHWRISVEDFNDVLKS